MKFPGTCIECGEKIEINEIGLWAKGIGVKHEKCIGEPELKCAVCGRPTGCPSCEFRDDCDIENVSSLCICKRCSDVKDPFSLYKESVKRNYSISR